MNLASAKLSEKRERIFVGAISAVDIQIESKNYDDSTTAGGA